MKIIVGRSLAVTVELLEETGHDGGTHDKGCDFHDPAPAVAPVWRGVVDRIGHQRHHLSGFARDLRSSAVLLTLLLAVITWGLMLVDRLE